MWNGLYYELIRLTMKTANNLSWKSTTKVRNTAKRQTHRWSAKPSLVYYSKPFVAQTLRPAFRTSTQHPSKSHEVQSLLIWNRLLINLSREGYMRSNLESWEPSQHLLIDIGKPRKPCVEVAGRRTCYEF